MMIVCCSNGRLVSLVSWSYVLVLTALDFAGTATENNAQRSGAKQEGCYSTTGALIVPQHNAHDDP